MPTPARTSLDEIVTAGRAILESDGLDGLTMQRIATAVGVRAPSLYKRVNARADLVRLIVEDVAREVRDTLDAATAVSGKDPRDQLRALADAYRRFARRQPAAFGLLSTPLPEASRPAPGLLADASRSALDVARRLAGEEHRLEAARTIVAWANGFIAMELAGAFRLGGDIDRAFAFGIERLAIALAEGRGPDANSTIRPP